MRSQPLGPEPPLPPRPIPREAVGRKPKLAVAAGMMWMVMSVVVTVVFGWDGTPVDDRILDEHGKKVKATATKVVKTGTKRNKHQVFEIHLEFEDVDGVARQATMTTTDTQRVEAARAKSPLAIEYDPSNIDRARWEGQYFAEMPAFVFYGLGALFVWGFCVVIAGVVLVMRARGLYRDGDACRGVVTKVRELRQNQKTHYAFEYSYETAKGSETGKWQTKPGSPAPEEQQTVWVIHDKRHHGRSVPVLPTA